MSNQSRDFEFFCGLRHSKKRFPGTSGGAEPYLNIKRCVKAHLKVSLFVLCEDTEEGLLENRSSKGVREDHDTICGVR